MINLFDNPAHEHLLSHKANEDKSNMYQGFIETTNVTQQGKDVIDLTFVLFIDTITANVDCD